MSEYSEILTELHCGHVFSERYGLVLAVGSLARGTSALICVNGRLGSGEIQQSYELRSGRHRRGLILEANRGSTLVPPPLLGVLCHVVGQ